MNLLLGIMVTLALIIVVPNVFGIQTRAVLSGSMEPALPTGSMVFVFPEDAEKIKLGTPVSFVLDDQGTVVTHRVVEIDTANREFTVKGDANETADANPVQWDNVIGVVRFYIPYLGYFLELLLTTQGKVIALTVILAVIILVLLLGEEKVQVQEPIPPVQDKVQMTEKKQVYSRKNRYVPRYTRDGGGDDNGI